MKKEESELEEQATGHHDTAYPGSKKTLGEGSQGITSEHIDSPQIQRTISEDLNHLSFNAVERVDVEVRNLCITTEIRTSIPFIPFLPWPGKETQRKTILGGVNLEIPAGQLMAIIGASGSGKVSSHSPESMHLN